MRDEVFRVSGSPGRMRARTVELDGEPWWLLSDVLALRGYPRQLARLPELLRRLDDDEAECVWVLQPGEERPRALWVVTAEGRAAVHDMYPQSQGHPRKRRPSGGSIHKAAGVEGLSARNE
ncbi:hypothetical protein ABT286_21785 [Streptomyces rochei]|uniref:hypothetical protein n=1 Tax=Streptomyces rochei TaxID=1928 RepID=UPI0017852945